ncbi:unnamed protein product [Rhizophagus irregularis]|nr:unnamed protein product [Rhizophagus irregularis]
MYRDKITRTGLINTTRDRTSAGGYVFDIDGTSLPHEIIERLRTWPSEDDFKEAIRIGYSEAIELADSPNTLEIIDNDDDDQYQNLADESNNNNEFADKNETTKNSMAIFPDLQYIINQKLIPQKQFESFGQLFTSEGFLNFYVFINIRKKHDAFLRHPKNSSNMQTLSETSSLNPNDANQVITEMTNNFNIQDNHINQQKIQWEGRKRLATIPIAAGIKVRNIIDANVSDIHPLILGGYLIIYSDKKICIAQIITINLWTNTCEAGGKLVGHIPAKEVLYYLNSSPFINSQSSFFSLTEIALEVFLHFKTPEMMSNLAKIFPK